MEKMYQGIFEKIAPFVPEEWNRIVFMANYSEGSYSMSFYVKCGEKYTDYHDLGYSRIELMKLFADINRIIAPVRAELTGKELWYTLTMCIEPDGSFKAEYDYNDVSEDFVAYKDGWRTKYLV